MDAYKFADTLRKYSYKTASEAYAHWNRQWWFNNPQISAYAPALQGHVEHLGGVFGSMHATPFGFTCYYQGRTIRATMTSSSRYGYVQYTVEVL